MNTDFNIGFILRIKLDIELKRPTMPLHLNLHRHGVHRAHKEARRELQLNDLHLFASRDDLVELDLGRAKLIIKLSKLLVYIYVTAKFRWLNRVIEEFFDAAQ